MAARIDQKHQGPQTKSYANNFSTTIPDAISIDLHVKTVNGPVVDMITTMSKIHALGMPLKGVIRRSTVEPARIINRPNLGTLSVGSDADVAVFALNLGKFGYTDCGRTKIIANVQLENRMTLRAGKIVSDPTGISIVERQIAPPQYFTIPKLQRTSPRATAEPGFYPPPEMILIQLQ